MKKVTFGTPEKLTPSYSCKNFNYVETENVLRCIIDPARKKQPRV